MQLHTTLEGSDNHYIYHAATVNWDQYCKTKCSVTPRGPAPCNAAQQQCCPAALQSASHLSSCQFLGPKSALALWQTRPDTSRLCFAHPGHHLNFLGRDQHPPPLFLSPLPRLRKKETPSQYNTCLAGELLVVNVQRPTASLEGGCVSRHKHHNNCFITHAYSLCGCFPCRTTVLER